MTVALLISQCATAASAQRPVLNLMPAPERVELGEGRLRIEGAFTVATGGAADSRISRAVDRFLNRLERKTGIPLAIPAAPVGARPAHLRIECANEGRTVQSLEEDESYRLEVTGQNIRLSAPSPLGVMHGLETLLQLVDLDASSFFIPSIRIEDRPRFRWRGLHMDVSRHWMPLEVIRRNLDAMSAVKLNVFHWHLSDDQGFRIESKKHPKLHLSGSEGNYYTQAEVKELIAYARDRGIRVVPEFDVPGHSTSWLVAYPEFGSAPGPYQMERSWGVFDPTMDPSRKRLYAFLDSFIGEMAKLFPDEYFHIGGDEVSGKHWKASARIDEFKKEHGLKDNRDLQAHFNRQLQEIVQEHGKTMIGWDEILHPDLPKTVVVHSWQGQASLAKGARQGYRGILSHGYYLDHMRPASFHYAVDPLGKDAAALSPEEGALIIGGEACMWAEFVNPDNVESRMWPRAAAIAERLWSPPQVQDVADMYRRLESIDRELQVVGVMHHANRRRMLDRMAGSRPAAPLAALAELLVPTGLGPRQRTRKYYSFTPLNRLVDAVAPESFAALRFEEMVDRVLATNAELKEIAPRLRTTLLAWQDNAVLLQPVIADSFLLLEIGPVAKMVADLSAVALEALTMLESGSRPSEEWQAGSVELLSRAEKPQAEMLIAVVPAIRKLVTSAGSRQ